MKLEFKLLTLDNSKYILVVLLLCFISYSCKKDSNSQSKSINIDLIATKAWVKSNFKTTDNNPFTTMLPNWDDIYTTNQGNQTIIEIGLNNPNRIFIGDSPNDANEPKLGLSKSNIRLVLFKNINKNTIVTGCYMAIVNNAQQKRTEILHYKNVGNLSGKVYYFNTDGSFSNGSLYAEGQIAKSTGNLNLLNQSLINIKLQLSDAKKLNGSLKDKTVAVKSPCADGIEIPIWGQSCVGAEGYEVCSPYISGFAHLPGSCDGDYGDNEGYAGTHGGGSSGNTGGTASEYNPQNYKILSDPAVDLQKLFNCFNTVSDNGATYSVTLSTDLPVNDDPLKLVSYQSMPPSPGHAFITMTKTNGNNSVSQSFGFYPSPDILSLTTGPVGSKLNDNGNHDYDASMTMSNITQEEFQLVQTKALAQKNSSYDINNYNCTNYALDVFNIIRDANHQIEINDWVGSSGFNYGKTPNGLYNKLLTMKENGYTNISKGEKKSPAKKGGCN